MGSAATRRSVIASGLGVGLHALVVGRGAGAVECGISPAMATARAEQITVEPIGRGVPMATPEQTLTLFRFTIPPGGVVSPHRHPGETILAIESGEMTYLLLKGSATITRPSSPQEILSTGETTILRPGDSLFYDRDTSHTASNAHDQVLVVLSVTLFASDQPATIPTDDEGNDVDA
jgi:quercetin dioxygenase-like cupin family protein